MDGKLESCYNDGRRTTDDGRRTTDDGRRTTDDGRRTTDDGRRFPFPVLAVARNLVSALRLLDVVGVFVDDRRVGVHWTIAPGSQFEADTDAYLTRLGIRLTPWEQACAQRYALAVATSGNGDLHRLDAPLVLLPHGAGYNRVLAAGRDAPAGLAESQLIHEGRVVPRVIGLEHESQRARLAAHCPPAASRGVVLGDPTRDRLVAGARLREYYRRAMGVSGLHKLIVLSSTWGAGSLFDVRGDLATRLVAAFPADEYRFAAIIHPNLAARLGAWEVGRRLSRARAAGLRLVPPDEWEGAVVAADLVIGDHGSVSLYAAAIGTPVTFGAYDARQILPDSPMAALYRSVPRLPREGPGPLDAPIRAALAQRTDSAGYRAAHEAMGLPGESLAATQRVIYDLLELDLPGRAPRVAAPRRPTPVAARHGAQLVLIDRCDRAEAVLRVRRFPAAVDPDLVPERASGALCRHLAVETTDPEPSLRENAEVLLLPADSRPGWGIDRAVKELAEVLALYENSCRAAGAVLGPGRCLVVARGADPVDLRLDHDEVDPAILPSILLALLDESGHSDTLAARLALGVRVRVGSLSATVRRHESADAGPSIRG